MTETVEQDYVTTAEIWDVWEIVKPGLEIVKSETGVEWSLEYVYAKCAQGDWMLFMAGNEGHFSMYSVNVNPHTGQRYLTIEVVYDVGTNDIERQLDKVEQLARDFACDYIEFYSHRKGFERKGWTVQDICYRRKV